MNEISTELCCGCSACGQICPKNAIAMVENDEGFLYPQIDETLCVHCNKCACVCPVNTCAAPSTFKKHAFIGQHNDRSIRDESTSGGVFSAIAESILQRGGVVFGAAFGDDFVVRHVAIERKADLSRLRNSKYVQSDMNNAYIKVKAFLEAGRPTLFSGTPCQISGLRNYLGREYENLFLVDVVCRSVASPLALRKYLEWQRARSKKRIVAVRFRDKSNYGYAYSQMTVRRDGEKKSKYGNGKEMDPLLNAYFSDVIVRLSCYHCKYRGSDKHRSDITLWDCFNVEQYGKHMDKRGTTKMLVHTKKGLDMLGDVLNNMKCEEIEPVERIYDVVKKSGMICVPDEKRNAFFSDAQTMDGYALYRKHFPITLAARCRRLIKIVLFKTGLYEPVRSLLK